MPNFYIWGCMKSSWTRYYIKRATFSSLDGDLTLASDVFCPPHPHPLLVQVQVQTFPHLLRQVQTFSLECLEGLCCCSSLSLYQVLSLLTILLQLILLVDCWKWVASLLSSFFLNLKLSSQTSPFLLSWTSNYQVVLLAFLQTKAQVVKSYFSLSSKLKLKLSSRTGTRFAIRCFYTDWEQRQVQNGPESELGGQHTNGHLCICAGTLCGWHGRCVICQDKENRATPWAFHAQHHIWLSPRTP